MNGEGILFDNQKIYSMSELKNKRFSQYKIAKMVNEGKLMFQRGVICLLSAASYYCLTTYIPDTVDVAIPRKAKTSTMPDWPQINIHYYPNDRYVLGVTTIREENNEFNIYDIEKTVVDVIFYKERVGIEETKEILINYLQRKNRNLNQLLKYATLMKCDKTLKHYLEVLI